MKRNKVSFSTRLDFETIALLVKLNSITGLNKTPIIETAIYEYAKKHIPPEEFRELMEEIVAKKYMGK